MPAEPYNEQQGIEFQRDVVDTYVEAGHAVDLENCVWTNRMTCDAVTTIGYAASRQKHMADLRRELGFQLSEAPIIAYEDREEFSNMCGVRVPGISPIQGGAADPSLVLDWFWPFYGDNDRDHIMLTWKNRGIKDPMLSWPDTKARGFTANDFAALLMVLVNNGFRPSVMLLSKDFQSAHDMAAAQGLIEEILPWLITPRRCSRVSLGFEVSLFLSPEEVQTLVDRYMPHFVNVGVKTYIHLQQHFSHYSNAGFGDYWNRQEWLDGLWHQREASPTPWTDEEYASRLWDIATRFAGNFVGYTIRKTPRGVPFDLVAKEITATQQFNNGMSEEEGNRIARVALGVTASGPYGAVRVMGSGNGR